MLRLRSISRAVLAATALSCTVPSVANAHDGACDGQAEDELLPRVRKAAQELVTRWRAPQARWGQKGSVKVQILGINDFHGRLNTGLLVAGRPVGGAAVLAAYLRDEEKTFAGTTFIAHAGDHVGASPPESALLQDEPAIGVLNLLTNRHCKLLHGIHPSCNVIGTLGNHEFDEGVAEQQRLIWGGNHEDGPFLERHYRGAQFPYLSANVVDEESGRPILPPFAIRFAEGEPVAFIGAVLEATPSVVTPEGVRGVRFLDEADAINKQVRLLKKLGVEVIVVLIHQGGRQTSYTGATQPGSAPTGEIVEIVSRLDGAVDVVVSGHAHAFTNALLPNAGGLPTLVTQSFSSGTAYGDIELTIDRSTHDVVEKSATIETTYGDAGPGLTPAADVAELVAQANAKVAPLVSRVVGESTAAFTRTSTPAGESTLGNLIADAQRKAMGTAVAMMNPGGIRADLDAGPITWGELFTIQPFGNDLVRMDLTGAQLRAVLEQQWSASATRILQVSGISYTWSAAGPIGSRVVDVQVGGTTLDLAATYSVTVNAFLASGGDGFTVLAQGTGRVVGPVDLAALVEYVEAAGAPLTPTIEGRVLSE